MMLLVDALAEINSRITIAEKYYAEEVPDYFEALKIAANAIEMQIELANLLTDLYTGSSKDSYSHDLVVEMLESVYCGNGKREHE